jgi:putative Mg2+ transporter-C (MgtC) family protein
VSATHEVLGWLGLPESLAETFRLGLLFRLTLASVLGGVIGLERELHGKPAGLRTNLLICVAAALFTEVSIRFAGASSIPGSEHGDPGRIAAQVLTGVGFIGAGTIIQSRGHVIGLTTAATLWVVTAIGMAVGGRAYVEAIGATVLVLVTLVSLGRLEDALIRRRTTHRYHFLLDADATLLEGIHRSFREAGLEVQSEMVEKDPLGFHATFEVFGPVLLHREIARNLVVRPGVHRMSRTS